MTWKIELKSFNYSLNSKIYENQEAWPFDNIVEEGKMITDKQFDVAYTAAGWWFFLTQFHLIKSWVGSKAELIDLTYCKGGFDSEMTGNNTRVSRSLNM